MPRPNRLAEVRKKISDALDSGNYVMGVEHINQTRTAKLVGFQLKHPPFRQILREECDKRGITYIRTSIKHGQANLFSTSMPFDDKTNKMGWAIIKQPAIYAVVCKATGRMYIGSSMRPDRRRHTHYYWLKNWHTWGSSNVFYGSISLAKDVVEHGRKNFYMTIIKSMPGATREQLDEEEAKAIEKIPREMLYNVMSYARATGIDRLIFIDDNIKQYLEFKKRLYDDIAQARKDFSIQMQLAVDNRDRWMSMPLKERMVEKRAVEAEKKRLRRIIVSLNRQINDMIKEETSLRKETMKKLRNGEYDALYRKKAGL